MGTPSHNTTNEPSAGGSPDVAIVDGIRSARESLATALRNRDYSVHLPSDIALWLDELRVVPPVVVLRVPGQSSSAVDQVQEIRERRPGAVVICISSVIDHQVCAGALGAGAAAVLGPDALSADVAMAIEGALHGHSVLPTEIAVHMAVKTATHPVAELTTTEIAWLVALAGGTSAETIARNAGYSPRHFRRILKILYGRLGATSMREALVGAAKAGVLERGWEPNPTPAKD